MVRASDSLTPATVYTRENLREIFRITDATINNGIFAPKGINSVFLFITEHKTPDRPQLVDKLEGETLQMQGQPQGRADRHIYNHHADGKELLLFYRLSVRQYPGAGFVYEGPFEYVSHEGSKPANFLLRRVTESSDQRAAEDAVTMLVARLPGGQGFRSSPEERRAIEDRAMKLAVEYFTAQGWAVDWSVAATHPYDLRCTRDGSAELHVEVKGSTTDTATIQLTRNEVAHAQEAYPNFALYVVRDITISKSERGEISASGGTPTLYHPWQPTHEDLVPIAYTCRLPTSGS